MDSDPSEKHNSNSNNTSSSSGDRKGSRQTDLYQGAKQHPPQHQQWSSIHHHPQPPLSITSPQSHLHPQGAPPSHPIMNPQRQPYYGASSPDPPSAASAPAAERGGPSSAPHYRRPASPGSYGNPPPPGPYSSGPSGPPPTHPVHYSSSQAYGRHPEYAKEDYRYNQQDRRREYDPAELGHDYPPMTNRDIYRSSSSREPIVAPTARHPASTAAAAYPPLPGQLPMSSTHSAIYQSSGPGHDQEMLDRDRRAAHPYSSSGRYTARSPSPRPYGSPPGNISYRHYYEQQQQQQMARSYRPDYYASDAEGEGGAMSQHHHYQQQQQHHASRAPSYRSWPAHEAPGREYPPLAAHQSAYYSSSRQPMQADRYENPAPPPLRAASPYQPYASRQPVHPAHASAGAWSSQHSPEVTSRPPMGYRRRSASVDEGIEKDKYFSHHYHNPSTAGPRSRSPPPRTMTPPVHHGHSPAPYQYEASTYNRAMPSSYRAPTYIPSRSPSPVNHVQHRSERKAPAMSIAQLLSADKSRDVTPEYRDEQPVDDRSRSTYRQYVQEHSPRETSPAMRLQERTPISDSPTNQRHNETARGPGQLAERARMLPIHGLSDHLPANASYGNTTRIEPTSFREMESAADDYPFDNVSMVSIRPRDERKVESSPHEDAHSISTTSTKTENWPEVVHPETLTASQDTAGKSQNPSVQVKRRPKAEAEKRPAKTKSDEKEAPADDGKAKAKRGRKPKAKDNPLEGPALPPTIESGPAGASRAESSSKINNGGLKRQRVPDSMHDDQELAVSSRHALLDMGEENGMNGPHLGDTDSDQEDYSQTKDLMTYMLEVHKRGQKVQRAYEKQSSVAKAPETA
ncbi:hypothetical protein BC939DRAFT_198614 [Gamsiella multidivaricata]|uniref:uncharacterized protein n=1 Tax=Gamsiella multidivaricata TaxID=101098 RepID=UPI00221FB2BE|nr:uncharacterized protein BC939DRAFT_198614 [Gamsiella multidivaricata]KAI7821878.1 hypothetical protein BC939DRAFT_198614 [Gamsiella multidivaricata]